MAGHGFRRSVRGVLNGGVIHSVLRLRLVLWSLIVLRLNISVCVPIAVLAIGSGPHLLTLARGGLEETPLVVRLALVILTLLLLLAAIITPFLLITTPLTIFTISSCTSQTAALSALQFGSSLDDFAQQVSDLLAVLTKQ